MVEAQHPAKSLGALDRADGRSRTITEFDQPIFDPLGDSLPCGRESTTIRRAAIPGRIARERADRISGHYGCLPQRYRGWFPSTLAITSLRFLLTRYDPCFLSRLARSKRLLLQRLQALEDGWKELCHRRVDRYLTRNHRIRGAGVHDGEQRMHGLVATDAEDRGP